MPADQNLLKRAAQVLADKQRNATSGMAKQNATYKREPYSVSLVVTLGNQVLSGQDRQGNTKVERTECDFILTAADLILNGVQREPARGDLVEVTFDGDSRTWVFAVMPYLGEDSPWRFCDEFHTTIRVHTKHRGFA